MIKIIGAFVVMFSVITLSMIPLYHHRYRIRLLRDFLQDFQYIHNELNSNLSSVPDLMEFLSRKGGKSTRSAYYIIYERISTHGVAFFQNCWEEVMSQYSLFLSSEEYGLLINIGEILGRYVLEEQLSSINNLIRSFKYSLGDEKKIYPEKKRVNLGIGTSLGMILIILLI